MHIGYRRPIHTIIIESCGLTATDLTNLNCHNYIFLVIRVRSTTFQRVAGAALLQYCNFGRNVMLTKVQFGLK